MVGYYNACEAILESFPVVKLCCNEILRMIKESGELPQLHSPLHYSLVGLTTKIIA